MMPDLGKYSEAVLSSYAATLLLLALLVLITLHKGRKARRALNEIERKRETNG